MKQEIKKTEVWVVICEHPLGGTYPHSAYATGEAALKAREKLNGLRIYELFLHGPLDFNEDQDYTEGTFENGT